MLGRFGQLMRRHYFIEIRDPELVEHTCCGIRFSGSRRRGTSPPGDGALQAMELRGQSRSQMEFGNEEKRHSGDLSSIGSRKPDGLHNTSLGIEAQ